MRVAQHMVALHQGKEIDISFRSDLCGGSSINGNNSDRVANSHSQDGIRAYINEASKLQLKTTEAAHKDFVKLYGHLQQKDQRDVKAYRNTARQLESLIGLSEALQEYILMNLLVETMYEKLIDWYK